jgi:hypothetical protein
MNVCAHSRAVYIDVYIIKCFVSMIWWITKKCHLIQAASPWLFVYPRGIQELLLYTKTKYNNPLIYVTENGNTLITFFWFFSYTYT